MKQTQNITVAVRIRPALQYEINHTQDISIENDANKVILEGEQTLKFDRVFGEDSTQEQVFEQLTVPVIEQFILGYSCSLMAYGQTSSGKSYTLGIPEQTLFKQFPKIRAEVGVIPRAILHFFQQLGDRRASIKISFIEVYNDQLRDLLTTDQQPIQIREKLANGFTQIYTTGNLEITVQTAQQALACFVNGGLNRTTAQTALNESSSRSHSIFSIILEQNNGQEIVKSKLNIVDLAGSERYSKALTTGQQFKEMVGINQGLLALGNVIKALSTTDADKHHVPYRDSKLTRLLQDSIGGTAKCVFIACVSPSAYNFDESSITLKYAARARNIVNKPIRVVEHAVLDEGAYVKLMQENDVLKEFVKEMTLKHRQLEEELTMARSQIGDETGSIQISPMFRQSGTHKQQQLAGQQRQSIQLNEQKLAVLLQGPQQEQMRANLEDLAEKCSGNQVFSPAFASELYNRLQLVAFRQALNEGLDSAALKRLERGIRNNQVNIESESLKTLLQLSGFLLQFIQFESGVNKRLARGDRPLQYTAFERGDYEQLLQQVSDEIVFSNQLKAELREQQAFPKLSAGKFMSEELGQARDFQDAMRHLKEMVRHHVEKTVMPTTTKKVLILDVDEEIHQIGFETDMVDTNADYDFDNQQYINQKSEYEPDEDQAEEENEKEEQDDEGENDDVVEKFTASIAVEQRTKLPPDVGELSRQLHSLEQYFDKPTTKTVVQSVIQQPKEEFKVTERVSVPSDYRVADEKARSGRQMSPLRILSRTDKPFVTQDEKIPTRTVLSETRQYVSQEPTNLKQMKPVTPQAKGLAKSFAQPPTVLERKGPMSVQKTREVEATAPRPTTEIQTRVLQRSAKK